MKGKLVPINTDILIDEIIVSPFAADYQFDGIKNVIRLLGFKKAPTKSSLYSLK